jgi:hypothetical protein
MDKGDAAFRLVVASKEFYGFCEAVLDGMIYHPSIHHHPPAIVDCRSGKNEMPG